LFETEKADRPFIVLASIVFFSSLTVSVWDFVWIQKAVFHLGVVNILGLVLFIVGVSVRVVGRKTLGRYYSYGLRTSQDQKLIKFGIYKYVRHPINLAAMLYSLGAPLVFSSLYGFCIMLVMIPLILYRTRIEEQMLVKKFGNEYLGYIKKTKKFIPFIY
jgi:protein-S-isoprenylcysteine O-methyltransferase Ste14